MPDCFDVVGFVAYEAGDVAIEGAFDCFGVALYGLVSYDVRLVEL